MRIIGCDLHARQQTLAMLDTVTGEVINRTLMHEGNEVREFYSQLPRPTLVGIEVIGPMQWFLNLLEELGIECQVGDATKIRAAEPHKQKHDRRDAELILKLLVEKRFPRIWMPSKEQLDLRALLLHRHHWVRLRTQVQNALQAIALANGLRRGPSLWSYDGQAKIAFLPLPQHASSRRSALQTTYRQMKDELENLTEQVAEQADNRQGARLLMTHPGVGPVTALATDVFLGDPQRFPDSKALASYVGMIPREYSSGARQRFGALTKQGNPLPLPLGRGCGPCRSQRFRVAAFLSPQISAKGSGESTHGSSTQAGIRLWIMLRDQIDYQEFCRRGQKQSGAACAGMPEVGFGANCHRPIG
jgi:transposase